MGNLRALLNYKQLSIGLLFLAIFSNEVSAFFWGDKNREKFIEKYSEWNFEDRKSRENENLKANF
jgi:hypothetical protein